MRAGVVGLSLAALVALATPAAAQLPAPPVGASDAFQAGGYAAVTFSRPEHPEQVERPEVSELAAAVLGWGRIVPRLSYLVEVDMAKRTTETWTGREADQRLVPVRAYLEYTRSDLLRVRAGRFLTPVGQWNEGHAEPLTWTPTRPLTTYRPFAKSLTGLLAAGQGTVAGRDAGYALFWSPSARLEGHVEDEEESSFVHAVGGRVAAEIRPGTGFGVSLAEVRRSRPGTGAAAETDTPGALQALDRRRLFGEISPSGTPARAEAAEDGDVEEREEDDRTRLLVAADLRWERPGMEWLAEGVWLPATEHAPSEGGAFAQGAVRIGGPVWAVGRLERFRPVDGHGVTVGYAGVTVRAGSHLVVKLGRQLVRRPSERIPDGWFLSFSSLF
ncbi:MAG: hypothetical protein PVI57_13145 [Gemmatimonadota bacterium]